MAKRYTKNDKRTILLVGEGPADAAFLKHVKHLYDRNPEKKITIKASDGGSPHDIIDTAIRDRFSFEERYVLLDADLITEKDRVNARKNKINLIVSSPHCLEGMLLAVLGQPIPDNSKECKAGLHPMLDGPDTERTAYGKVFSKEVLDKTDKEQIVILRGLIGSTK